MKRLLLRLALVVGALALCVPLAELAVRAADPFGISYYRDIERYRGEAITLLSDQESSRLFQNTAAIDIHFSTFRFATNELGLRSAEPGAPLPFAPPSDRLRILCIGDSSTLGWGVDDEHTWARVLEREGRTADGRPLECLNAGHNFYDSVQEADLLRQLGPALRPAVVLVMFNTNDLTSTWASFFDPPAGDPTKVEPGFLRSFVNRRLPSLSHLWRYLEVRETMGRVEQHDFSLDDIPSYPEGWPRVAAALADMRATCEAIGARLVLFDHADPHVPELPAWCEEHGVARIDGAWTPEEWRMDVRNSPADPHANALGNRILAEKARAGLAALGLLR